MWNPDKIRDVMQSGVMACDDECLEKLVILNSPNSTIGCVLGFLTGDAIPPQIALKLLSVFPEIVE